MAKSNKQWWPVDVNGNWTIDRNKVDHYTEPPRVTGIFKFTGHYYRNRFVLDPIEISENSEVSEEVLRTLPRLAVFATDMFPFLNRSVKGIIQGTIRYSKKGSVHCVVFECDN